MGSKKNKCGKMQIGCIKSIWNQKIKVFICLEQPSKISLLDPISFLKCHVGNASEQAILSPTNMSFGNGCNGSIGDQFYVRYLLYLDWLEWTGHCTAI